MTSHLMNRNLHNSTIPGFSTHIIDSEPVWYHRHTFYEVFYIISGTASHLVNGHTQMLSTGDLLFLSTKDDHMFCEVEQFRCVRRDIMLSPSLFEEACAYLSPALLSQFLNREIPTVYHLSASKIASLERKLNTALLCSNTDPASSQQLIRAFLIDLLSQHLQQSSHSAIRQPQWVTDLMSAFSNISHFKTETSVILKEYAYNLSYMRRVFKQHTGLTMTEFRKHKQLEYAKSILLSSNEPIEKIADICGFNSASYFFRYFKSQVGASPKKYRDARFLELSE